MHKIYLWLAIAALALTANSGRTEASAIVPLSGSVQFVGPYPSDPTTPINVGLQVSGFAPIPLPLGRSPLDIVSSSDHRV